MDIHVVQPGETIYSIAEKYSVSAARLIQDNGLIASNYLVVGQTIVIVYPKQVYTVQEGDSLISISDSNGITLIQLLRNNPYLSDREFIYPGETLIISYNNNKIIATNGYAYPFINKELLRKTLPFLTYLSIFNYRVTAEGDIIGINDTEIIQIARQYGVAPIMLLSTLAETGSLEVAFSIFYNDALVDRLIDNILNILKTNGYYGLNVPFRYINEESRIIYDKYITKLTNRLNNEGYPVFVTLNPLTLYNQNEITFDRVNYFDIGQIANGIMILSYNWGYSFGPPAAVTSVFIARNFLDYAVAMIPPNKIYVGLPIIGYDWQLPYEIGVSRANSISTDSAVALAHEVGATIEYDKTSQSPFFKYIDNSYGVPKQHIVWFKDARSVNSIVNSVPEYGFQGVGIWNIMNFFPQMWLVINSQYNIETVLI